MFVGVPGSGKSTFWRNYLGDCNYVSSDAIIDEIAKLLETTYDTIFSDTIKLAQNTVERDLEYFFTRNNNIVWDQTNLTVAGRRKKLAMIPDDWKVIAIWFPVPEAAEWKRRLDRPGKTIPPHVLENMVNTFVIPDTTEGFNEVYRFDAFERKLYGKQ